MSTMVRPGKLQGDGDEQAGQEGCSARQRAPSPKRLPHDAGTVLSPTLMTPNPPPRGLLTHTGRSRVTGGSRGVWLWQTNLQLLCMLRL